MSTRAQSIAVAALLLFVVRAPAARAQAVPAKLSLERPDWVSSDAFSSLTSVRILSNGMVLAADTKDVEVHLLDANGKKVRQIGRSGAGPGEYTRPLVVALPGDSTLLLDVGARRYIVIDPRGQITKTEGVTPALGAGADAIAAADSKGRLLFGHKVASVSSGVGATSPIGRWARGADHFDTVTMFQGENPKIVPLKVKNSPIKDLAVQSRQVFAAVNDWVAAPSGRIAIIHAVPYRVDWVELNGKITQGTEVAVTRVPVTEIDRKTYEPDGPPYRRTYAAMKSPFMAEDAVADNQDNLWVPRNEAAGFKSRRWDVFAANGKLRGTVMIPSGRKLMAVTARHAYIRYTDSDGLQWIERYAR